MGGDGKAQRRVPNPVLGDQGRLLRVDWDGVRSGRSGIFGGEMNCGGREAGLRYTLQADAISRNKCMY